MSFGSPSNLLRVFIPYDRAVGSRDRYGAWSLAPGDTFVLAFLADAPGAARSDTGRYIERWIGTHLAEHGALWRDAVARNDPGHWRDLLQDLWDALNGDLARDRSGTPSPSAASPPGQERYAAISLAVKTPAACHLLSTGDTVAYLRLQDRLRRHSASTALPGSPDITPPDLAFLPAQPVHLREGDYIGGDALLPHPSVYESIDLTTPGYLILLSDGVEHQLTLPALAALLLEEIDRDTLILRFTQLCEAHPPLDDLAALGLFW